MQSSGMLRHVPPVRTDVSKELSASIIRVTRFNELGTMLAITSNRHTRRIGELGTLVLVVTSHADDGDVPQERQFLQGPHGVTSQKTAFFIVTALRTSNLTMFCLLFAFERKTKLLDMISV
jgi:hypothetical protein